MFDTDVLFITLMLQFIVCFFPPTVSVELQKLYTLPKLLVRYIW